MVQVQLDTPSRNREEYTTHSHVFCHSVNDNINFIITKKRVYDIPVARHVLVQEGERLLCYQQSEPGPGSMVL